MAARLARWEESRRRNALRQQRQPQHVTTDVGRHDLFAQPHKQSSPIKDPFARPPHKATIVQPLALPDF